MKTKRKRKKMAKRSLSVCSNPDEGLNKAAKEFQKSDEFLSWLDRVQSWLDHNYAKISQLFTSFCDDEMELTYSQLKAGLRDLDVPCSDVELHLVCLLTDTNKNNLIGLSSLETTLKTVRSCSERNEQSSLHTVQLAVTKNNKKQCPNGCSMPFWDGNEKEVSCPRFAEISFRFLPFDELEKHPAHFTTILETRMTFHELSRVVGSLSGIAARKFHFFPSKTSQADFVTSSKKFQNALPEHSSLEDIGVIGGTKFHPVKFKLFYDYEAATGYCPILLCDHYYCDTISPFTVYM